MDSKFNPQPSFSSDNPYWRKIVIPGVRPEYQPQPSAQDFLYACTWEMYRPDIIGACFVREAMMRSFWVNLRFTRIKYKEITKSDAKQVN